MIGLRSAGMFGLILWFSVVMGLLMGANAGYTVQDAQNASASYNRTHAQVANDTTNVTIDFNETNKTTFERQVNNVTPEIETPADPYIQDGVRSFTRNMVHLVFTLSFGAADASAEFFYHNQWIPKPLVSGVLQVVGFAPVVGAGLLQLGKVARFWQ
jgi:hypothetical protein